MRNGTLEFKPEHEYSPKLRFRNTISIMISESTKFQNRLKYI